MEEETDVSHILSIQSHVVYGYVGNKSATFPLQLLGFDVSPLNSVQFSNHTGYKSFKGQVLHSDDVSDLYNGLQANDIHHFSHVLTGYIGSSSFLEEVVHIVKDLRKHNPQLIYACDPVMGDNGKMYVKPELLPLYKEKVVPLADIVTPNQFELELLSGVKINSEKEALQAIQTLHDIGAKTVVISSTNLGKEGSLMCIASSIKDVDRECYSIEFPRLPAYFSGSGDLFSALLVAWLHKHNNLKLALEKTVASTQAVLKRTLQYCKSKIPEDCSPENGKKPPAHTMELRLIQSKADLENPNIVFQAQKISI